MLVIMRKVGAERNDVSLHRKPIIHVTSHFPAYLENFGLRKKKKKKSFCCEAVTDDDSHNV